MARTPVLLGYSFSICSSKLESWRSDQILPGTGRGTMERSEMVEGSSSLASVTARSARRMTMSVSPGGFVES